MYKLINNYIIISFSEVWRMWILRLYAQLMENYFVDNENERVY